MDHPKPRKALYAILSGVMLTASFPPGNLDWMVWFALVPLLKALVYSPPSQAFRLGVIAGISHFLTLIYWIIVVLEHYGGMNILMSLSALVLLSLYLALYLGVFSYFFTYLKASPLPSFMAASLWTGLEYLRTHLLTGFPWCLLGYTQFKNLTLIQISDLGGVYAVSFLIVFANTLASSLVFPPRLHRPGWLRLEILLGLLMVCFTLSYGHVRSERMKPMDGQTFRIAVIQGSIDQAVKWEPAYQDQTLKIYDRLTRYTYGFHPHLIVWPETSAPFFFQTMDELSKRVIKIAREAGAYLLFGSPAFRKSENKVTYYNRAYLLSPGGDLSGFYDKVHLVPFGEYVPLKRLFPFAHRLVQAAGDFSSGKAITPFSMGDVSAGVLICFEVIFPELASALTEKGADLLVNLTNDAWFGITSAPYQHLSMAVFRAVENRRPVVRAANTGISAFIAPNGEILKESDLFVEAVLTHSMPMDRGTLTLYTRYQDFFAIGTSIISLLSIFYFLCYNVSFSKRIYKEAQYVSRGHLKDRKY